MLGRSDAFSDPFSYQSGTVIKIDNLDQNNLLANQTPSLSSRDTSS